MEIDDKSPNIKKAILKSILKKQGSNDQSNNSMTQSSSDLKATNKLKRVNFPDRSKNQPLHVIYEVEPIVYPELSKKTGCCVTF